MLDAFGTAQAMDIIFQTTESPNFTNANLNAPAPSPSKNKSTIKSLKSITSVKKEKYWSETVRPYVWDAILAMNQSYVQLVQAACDTYLRQHHFVMIYAQL